MRNFVGQKCKETSQLDIKEIAKLVRKDIKEAVKAGDLPQGIKTSVRIERFSMGQSINVSVSAIPMNVINPEYLSSTNQEIYTNKINRFTDDGENIIQVINGIVEQYNYHSSDPMTDYFSVRFYSNVSYEHGLLTEMKKMYDVVA